MNKLLIAVALLVLVAGGALAALSLAFDRTKVRTHTVAEPVREIVVKSGSGDVELSSASGRIDVRETQHYTFEKPTLDLDVKDGVLTLDSDCGAFFTCYADLRVTVPAGIKVTVGADSGDVQARGIDVRELDLQSDSGDVSLELAGRQGLVRAHTDSGDVFARTVDARDVDARTDSGDVSVDAAGRRLRRVVAHTDSGDVSVDAAGRRLRHVDAHTDSGGVSVDAAGRRLRHVDAQTDSGDVEVTVPRGDYAVDAETDSGDVNTDGITRNDRSPSRSRRGRTQGTSPCARADLGAGDPAAAGARAGLRAR